MACSLSTTTMLTSTALPKSIEPARASIGHYKLFAQDAVGKIDLHPLISGRKLGLVISYVY